MLSKFQSKCAHILVHPLFPLIPFLLLFPPFQFRFSLLLLPDMINKTNQPIKDLRAFHGFSTASTPSFPLCLPSSALHPLASLLRTKITPSDSFTRSTRPPPSPKCRHNRTRGEKGDVSLISQSASHSQKKEVEGPVPPSGHRPAPIFHSIHPFIHSWGIGARKSAADTRIYEKTAACNHCS